MGRSTQKAAPFSIRLRTEDSQLNARGRRSEEEVLLRYPFVQTFEGAVSDSTTSGR